MIFKLKYLIFKFFLKILIKLNFIESKKKNCFLLYHSVTNKLNSYNLDNIHIKKFTEQCNYISKCEKKRLSNLNDNFRKKSSITFTFDDGYKTIIDNVFPIIKKYKIPIIIFICPDLVGKKKYLSISDLKTLNRSNLVEFGIHGYRHIYYGNHNLENFKKDLDKSLNWFKKNLSLDLPISFSFPFGSFNDDIISYLNKQNKIKYCFNSKFNTFNHKQYSRNLIPRLSIWDFDNIESFKEKINGKWDIINYFIKSNKI